MGRPGLYHNRQECGGEAAFKNHYALWFYQGALLKESTALLHNTSEEKTKGIRQIRFEKLTPGKQREYADHISQAKREATKLKETGKNHPDDQKWTGLYDKYKNC